MLDTVSYASADTSQWFSGFSANSPHHGRHTYTDKISSRLQLGSSARITNVLGGAAVKGRVASVANSIEAELAYPEYRDYETRLAVFDQETRGNERIQAIARAGFFLDGCVLKCFKCGITITFRTYSCTTSGDITADHLRRSPQCAYAKSEQLRQLMRSSANERLRTFAGRWTQSIPNESLLAKTGFYVDPNGDGVPECAFCRIKISSWSPNEHPFDTHGRLAPFCPFVVDPPQDAIGYDICGTGPYGQAVPNAVTHSAPQYPNLASPKARMSTFDTWRGLVDPEALVETGLFFLKEGDSTKCYHCGIGFQGWQETDVPWEEHARLSPNCELIRLRRKQKIEGLQESPGEKNPLTFLREGKIQLESRDGEVPAPPSVSTKLNPPQEGSCSIFNTPEGLSQSATSSSRALNNSNIKIFSSPGSRNTESLTCKVCLVRQRETVMLPCNHFVTCATCAATLTHCPMCGTDIEQLFRPTSN
ncbi:death-associated inhibitor of apoptosis 1-like isoform X3 [Varroa destructor]|uniref:RING-type domain-containing protein n=1 Tax=Varroa destructor TaxID=109461 RepID=A0A7M7JBG8_VARDE|nr:death-associated inhibitor of apoptosis 1-like isoform X3 [Varroa destructor]